VAARRAIECLAFLGSCVCATLQPMVRRVLFLLLSAGTIVLGCVSDDATKQTKALACSKDKKNCDGRCVDLLDPVYGCSPTSCLPCAEAAFTKRFVCDASKQQCAVDSVDGCVSGRADCDLKVENGCERDVTTRDDCGACGVQCAAPRPNCLMQSGVAACTDACESGLTNCAGVCANLSLDLQNCGGCGVVCPVPKDGEARCEKGKCAVSCLPGSKISTDGKRCETDPNACLKDVACIRDLQCCSGACQSGKCTPCVPIGGICSVAQKCCAGPTMPSCGPDSLCIDGM
jgi:hypothetical protein